MCFGGATDRESLSHIRNRNTLCGNRLAHEGSRPVLAEAFDARESDLAGFPPCGSGVHRVGGVGA